MGTLSDYIDWRGDLRFSEVELCEVDSLILSLLIYIKLDNIVPSAEEDGSVTLREAVRDFIKLYQGKKAAMGKLISTDLIGIAVKAARSRRYAGIRLSKYVNDVNDDEQRQFCAVRYKIARDRYFIAFRGTDDTLVGWKESFNMSFMRPIPAQKAAVEYVNKICAKTDGGIYLGGHSKGGNLAVYSAVECDDRVKEKILSVFNNDGPGFDKDFIEDERYKNIKSKIRTIIPQSSVVGMLLEHEEDYEVVKSRASGLLQHQGHTWEVLGGSFIHLDTVTEDSKLIDEKMKEWLEEMSPMERAAFIDTIFETLSSTNATTLTELSADKGKLVKAWSSLDPRTRSLLMRCVSILVKHNALTIIRK